MGMTLKRTAADRIRLVECPFCDADLSDVKPATHLERCRDFHAACGGVLA